MSSALFFGSIASRLAAGFYRNIGQAEAARLFNRTGRGLSTARLVDLVSGPRARVAQTAALAFVLEDVVNYAKDNGPYTDRTGYLRRSLSWAIIDEGEITAHGTLEDPLEGGTNETIDGVLGYVFASAEYAEWVEFKPGYWVLSGALVAKRGEISRLLGIKLKASGILGHLPSGEAFTPVFSNRSSTRRRRR